MNKLHLPIILFCLFQLFACQEYVPDPIDPRIPKYSEAGKNTAGAIINGSTIWLATRPCGLFANNCEHNFSINSYLNDVTDSVTLSIWGRAENPDLSGSLRFHLSNVSLESSLDLKKLIGVYQINNNSMHKAFFEDCQAHTGRLEIKHVADNTVAGTFSLYVEQPDCGTMAIEWGRFDFNLTEIAYQEQLSKVDIQAF